jgi:hypothetical protein
LDGCEISQQATAQGRTFSLNLNFNLGHLAMAEQSTVPSPKLIQYINLKLATLGCPTYELGNDSQFEQISALVAHQREIDRLLRNYLCPADNRIQTFLYDFLEGAPLAKSPTRTFVLDRYGMARVLSLPPTRDSFASEIVNSYRVKQGVLNNPKCDRRTIEGIFHIAEGGLPVHFTRHKSEQ